jgi:3-oxoacyl-[acyl-carrier-protein] synthase-1
MNAVYLAGCGLACGLGADLAAAQAALRDGRTAPGSVELGNGLTVPFHAIDEPGDDWLARAQRLVQRVARESGALDDRRGALFIASSSVDVGMHETITSATEPDFHDLAECVAGWLDWRGPVFTVSTACTSALNAVRGAAALIRAGDVDHALVLGVELGNRLTVAGFAAMQLLAARQAQPLGAARDGLVLGEAVAALHLSRRSARWRLAGEANVVDGRDAAGAVPSAIVAMCRQALAASGLEPADIGLVKLQAAGSPTSDAVELAALREVFDPLPPLVSLKAHIGHTLGASGAAEIALLARCLETGEWPACDDAPDPSLRVALAARAPRDARYVLASILGFGGGHAAVVLEDRGEAST